MAVANSPSRMVCSYCASRALLGWLQPGQLPVGAREHPAGGDLLDPQVAPHGEVDHRRADVDRARLLVQHRADQAGGDAGRRRELHGHRRRPAAHDGGRRAGDRGEARRQTGILLVPPPLPDQDPHEAGREDRQGDTPAVPDEADRTGGAGREGGRDAGVPGVARLAGAQVGGHVLDRAQRERRDDAHLLPRLQVLGRERGGVTRGRGAPVGGTLSAVEAGRLRHGFRPADGDADGVGGDVDPLPRDVPVELAVVLEAVDDVREVVAHHVGLPALHRRVRAPDADPGLGARLGHRHVGRRPARARDGDVAHLVAAVGVGLRVVSGRGAHEALDAVAGVTGELPHQRLGDVHRPVDLDGVVGGEGEDPLPVRGAGGGRQPQQEPQPQQEHRQRPHPPPRGHGPLSAPDGSTSRGRPHAGPAAHAGSGACRSCACPWPARSRPWPVRP